MSYTRTLSELVSDVRTRGEFHLPRPPHADIVDYINESYSEFYDLLVEADPARFGSVDSQAIVSGTEAYDLPADHLRTLSVAVSDSTSVSGRRGISRIDWAERDNFSSVEVSRDLQVVKWTIFAGQIYLWPTPRESGTLYLQYAPVIADLDSDGSYDAETLDLVSGIGREYVILGGMIRCAESEGRPSDTWEARRERLARKIEDQLVVQESEPIEVADIYVYGPTGAPYRRR